MRATEAAFKRGWDSGVLAALYILHNGFGADTEYDEVATGCSRVDDLVKRAKADGNLRDSGLKECRARLLFKQRAQERIVRAEGGSRG